MTVTNEERGVAVRAARDEYSRRGERRTYQVRYRGTPLSLPVVTLPINVPLLNHNSHRLAAQLKDLDRREEVLAAPTSVISQDLLAELIVKMERYAHIREDVRINHQVEPGLISVEGVLINGNTRVVALRELGVPGIDVAVLPEDALESDFLDLEISLQMAKLEHQDYTYTNTLLMMRNCLDLGMPEAELARKMNWKKRGVEKVLSCMRILNLIEELRERHPQLIPYRAFDQKQQHLEELDRDYEYEKRIDAEAAYQLLDNRILALLLGATKLQLREMDEQFFVEHVVKRLQDETRIFVETYMAPANYESIDIEPAQDLPDLTRLIDRVINEIVENGSPDTDGLPNELQDLREAISVAAEDISTDRRRRDLLAEPVTALKEARFDIERITERYEEYSQNRDFKVDKFRYELDKVQKKLEELDRKVRSAKPTR